MALIRAVLSVAACVVAVAGASYDVPTPMRAVVSDGSCATPFPCLNLTTIAVPQPDYGQVLIRVEATSVNPCDVDVVEGVGGCPLSSARVPGDDIAGKVRRFAQPCVLALPTHMMRGPAS